MKAEEVGNIGAAIASLLASSTTLVCCVLPTVLVSLGTGSIVVGLVSTVPQFVWLSEQKLAVFGIAAVFLALSGASLWRGRRMPCPVDPALARKCKRLRHASVWIYAISVALFSMGAVFAFVSPWAKRRAVAVDEVLTKIAALDSEARNKICAHRANSVAMYRQALGHFECIEIDVHINPAAGGPAAVYHLPDKNNHGLTLDFLLSHEQLPTGKLWLDTKDLSGNNWPIYLDQLKVLIPPERRADVVVETVWSSSDVEFASAAFRRSGFKFSYYLPTREALECAAARTQQCDNLRRQVVTTISLGFSHLSFDARAQTFVASIRKDLPPGVKLLTWDLSRSWPNPKLLDEVEIYIVNYPSLYAT